jgi:hypothetical protein
MREARRRNGPLVAMIGTSRRIHRRPPPPDGILIMPTSVEVRTFHDSDIIYVNARDAQILLSVSCSFRQIISIAASSDAS